METITFPRWLFAESLHLQNTFFHCCQKIVGRLVSESRIEEPSVFEIALPGAWVERVGTAYYVDGSSKSLLESGPKTTKREKREGLATFDANVDVWILVGLIASVGTGEVRLPSWHRQ